MKSLFKQLRVCLLTLALLPTLGYAAEAIEEADIFNGYYSRVGNDGKPAEATGYSLSMKFYPDQWVILLYIPYPYSNSVSTEVVHKVFAEVKQTVTESAYVKSDFGLLEQAATVSIEPYGIENDRALFDCGGSGTCATIFFKDALHIVKTGIINDHIIKYNRVPNSVAADQ